MITVKDGNVEIQGTVADLVADVAITLISFYDTIAKDLGRSGARTAINGIIEMAEAYENGKLTEVVEIRNKMYANLEKYI